MILFCKDLISFTQKCLVLRLIGLGHVIGKKKIHQGFPICHNISSWSCAWSFISPRDTLCQVYWNWRSGSGKNYLLIEVVKSLMSQLKTEIVLRMKKTLVFTLSLLSSLRRWRGPSLNFLLHPRMLCTKFGWNWSNDSGERKMKWKRTRKLKMLTDWWSDGQTDDGQQAIRDAHVTFQLRWTKRSPALPKFLSVRHGSLVC